MKLPSSLKSSLLVAMCLSLAPLPVHQEELPPGPRPAKPLSAPPGYPPVYLEELAPGPTNPAEALSDTELQQVLERLQKIREKADQIQSAADFLSLGIKAYEDLHLLARRWDYPKAEEIFNALSTKGPGHISDFGDQTLAGLSSRYLNVLQARREYHTMTKGLGTPEEKVRKIRDILKEHPDWLSSRRNPKDRKTIFKEVFVRGAEELSGVEAIDLLADGNLLDLDRVKKYSNELLEYIKKIGPEKTLATPYLLERVAYSENAAAIPVIQEWLMQTKSQDEDDLRPLVSTLSHLPDTQRVLTRLLGDSRHAVIRLATGYLCTRYPNAQSLAAIERRIADLKDVGADAQFISYLSARSQMLASELRREK